VYVCTPYHAAIMLNMCKSVKTCVTVVGGLECVIYEQSGTNKLLITEMRASQVEGAHQAGGRKGGSIALPRGR
jgi:hypothetical protein